ncbi:unnamed protein product [Dibothriocephalus latus]|uniref:SGF29 C-terminal domain-containing protein n=1 Tax=Dibothriocephalus latus TaxID=60516 RepID=A0A3P7NBX7_DIBLA|nr:unnamed protein product [Dibothriocephalus latus]
MESELVARVNELIELCKHAVVRPTDPLVNVSSRRNKDSHGPAQKAEAKTASSSERCREYAKVTAIYAFYTVVSRALLNAQSKILEIKAVEHKIKVAKGPRSFRRGVLMSLLQDNAKSLPLWAGKVGASPPPLCGAVGTPKPEDYVVAGDHVAALVPDPEARGSDSDTLESWILAEIVAYSADKKEFRVDDVDAEEAKV